MKTIAVESCGKGNSEYEERELICIILHPHLNFTMLCAYINLYL